MVVVVGMRTYSVDAMRDRQAWTPPNVHVKVMQERLRHSTSKLRLDIYSRLSQSEQDAAAVEALPRLELGA